MAAAVALAKLERPAPVAKGQVDWAEVCQEAADKLDRRHRNDGWSREWRRITDLLHQVCDQD
jgi:hypothetical protein